MQRSRSLLLVVGMLAIAPFMASAQEPAKKAPPKGEGKSEPLKETLSETRHTITMNGARLEYEATAGTLVLKDDADKPRAGMFFIAYQKADVKNRSQRPITFCFNGGPGSSSVWLHLGAFGPKRVALGEDKGNVAPPFRLVENESSLLDLTDLVFIDPVSTGFSRAATGQNAKEFHGVQEDIQSVGEFIRLYVTRFRRWNSPKFLAGESYGTTRAAGLVGYLQDHVGMNFNGVILVSSVLNFQTLRFDEGNDLPFILFLPTYTATAWYHKKLASELQADRSKTLAEVEKFALGPYTTALMKGNTLPPDEQQHIARKLAHFTGLSEDYVKQTNLRINISRFTKELLRNERRTVGRYDSRFKGIDPDSAGERPEYDPSYAVVQGAYTALLNEYVRNELRYENEQTYRILTDKVQPWDYGNAKNRYLNVAPTMRRAMTQNRGLRVFVANGYYDLATPYFATIYTFNQLGLDPSLTSHVTMTYYDSGHMMYITLESLHKLKKDLTPFIETAGRK